MFSNYTRTTCRFCNSTNLKKILPLGLSPIADSYISQKLLSQQQESYPLDVYMCEECGLVQLLYIVHPENIYRNYLYVTTSSPYLINHYETYVGDILQYTNIEKKSLVIDIGSNDGSLLKIFKQHELKVLGIDPAKEIAKKASCEGIPTIPEFLTPEVAHMVVGKYGQAKLITANNIVANIDELDDFFMAIKILLKNQGFFVLESGYWLEIVQNMVFDTIYHEHLSYFNILPLKNFALKFGLKLIKATPSLSKGGSLRYIFVKDSFDFPEDGSLQPLILRETELQINKVAPNLNYAHKIELLKQETTELFKKIKQENKNIAVYGASNTSTTLLNYYDLNKYIDFFVDDNPIKIGLFSPVFHIPVYGSEHLYRQKVDYVFIAAWRFADLILTRHQQYNWKWIIPLPKLKIIE